MVQSINPTTDSGTDLTDPEDVVMTLVGYAAFAVLLVVGIGAGLWAVARGREQAGLEQGSWY